MATKTFPVSKDAWIINDRLGGTSYGAGKDYHLAIGEVALYDYRSLIQFTTDFSDVASITSAVLTLKSSRSNDGTVGGYARGAHGTFSSTTMQIDRVTGVWSAGTYGNDEIFNGSNAVEWSNKPTSTTTGRATVATPSSRPSSPTNLTVDITDIVRAWAPATVTGGGATTNYGIQLKSNEEGSGSDNAYYEFYSQEGGSSGISGAVAPFITLTYTETTSVPPVDPEEPPVDGGGTGTLYPTVTPLKPSGDADGTSLAKIVNLNDSNEWTPTSQYAMPEFSWSYTDGGGGACASWRLWIHSASSGGTEYFDSGTVSDAAHAGDTSVQLTPDSLKPVWMPGGGWSTITGLVNGTVYYWQIQVTDAAGQSNISSREQFKIRWGQALYEFDSGASYATTSGWDVDRGAAPSGTQSSAVYQTSGVKSTAVITGIAPSTPSAGTIQFTCAAGHSFIAGDVINIVGASPSAYNLSSKVVLSSGLTSTAFRITDSTTGTYASGGVASLVAYQPTTATVTGVSASTGIVTYTTSAVHGLVANQLVTMTGINPAGYNLADVRILDAPTTTTFRVTNAATGAFVSGGTATAHGRPGVMSSITNAVGNGTQVTYTSKNSFAAGQTITTAGITPSVYNLTDTQVLTATASQFTVGANVTGTYISGGQATAKLSSVISDISGHNRYLHAYLRMSSDDGTKPKVSDLTFSFLNSIQLPDNWYGDPATTYYFLDQEVRRFGTKAVRIETTSVSDAQFVAYRQFEGDDIGVVPSTTYTFSAYIKVGLLSGANNIRLIVQAAGGVSEIANSGAHTEFAADSEGWRRMSVTLTTSATTTSVRPMLLLTNTADAIGNYFWADGVLFEEGTVVRSWTPGFVTQGVTFEGGGLNIDTSRGGRLRLKGSTGGARDQVEVGASGLVFGGSSSPVQVYSGTANILDVSGDVKASLGFSSPATGKTAIELTSQSTDTGLTLGTDTTLYRSGAGALKTDGSFNAASITSAGAISSTTSVTAGSGLTVSAGNLSVSSGTITASGNITSSSDVIADFVTSGNTFYDMASGYHNFATFSGTTSVAISVTVSSTKTTAASEADFTILLTQFSTVPGTTGVSWATAAANFNTTGDLIGFTLYGFRSASGGLGVSWMVGSR